MRDDLFIPKPDPALPPPPWPAVVLSHGFARDRTRHRDNAMYLAQRGVVVLTPDMASLLGGGAAQLDCIADVVADVAWLAERSAAPDNALTDLVDPARIGLAGHSAGGAISFEAAIDTQNAPMPVAAVCLLDAVPWDRTIARAADFPALPFASWRSEPGPCNADGSVLSVLSGLPFPTEDVLIVGATHCDPENPSDALCALACGSSTPDRTVRHAPERLKVLSVHAACSPATLRVPLRRLRDSSSYDRLAGLLGAWPRTVFPVCYLGASGAVNVCQPRSYTT